MRATPISVHVPRIRREAVLRHAGYCCAASAYLAFGGGLFLLAHEAAQWVAGSLVYFGADSAALGCYLLGLVAWVAPLPSFARFAAREIEETH